MVFEYYVDTRGEWRWRFRAGNGETIAESSESYHNKADCLHAIELIKAATIAPVTEIMLER